MSNLTPVTHQRHATMKWRRPQSFDFARNRIAVPLSGFELADAALAFPLAFLRDGDSYFVAALLGVQQDHNLFVDGGGRWLGRHVPAVFRSYPFAMGLTGQGQPVLCVDEDSGLVSEGSAGEAFFTPEGGVSAALQPVVSFLEEVQHGNTVVRAACASLQQAGLIEPWPLAMKRGDRETKLEGLFRINETALAALPDAQFLELRKHGALAAAHTQLLSMRNMSRLAELAGAAADSAPLLPAQGDIDLSWMNSSSLM
jgi:hypothetical protein